MIQSLHSNQLTVYQKCSSHIDKDLGLSAKGRVGLKEPLEASLHKVTDLWKMLELFCFVSVKCKSSALI